MIESEVQKTKGSSRDIPKDIVQNFLETRQEIWERSVLPWAEHCTECAIPHCYSTCDFYTPREDLKCRRFVDGMVPIDLLGGHSLMKITFKHWGKLEAQGGARLVSSARATRMERFDRGIGSVVRRLAVPYHLQVRIVRHRAFQKRQAALKPNDGTRLPTHFLLECYNPRKTSIRLLMSLCPFRGEERPPYHHACVAEPGYNRIEIPVSDITVIFDLSSEFLVRLVPELPPSTVTLFFGIMEFVTFRGRQGVVERSIPAPIEPKAKKAKCVVWDLDNTLWRGILVENGIDRVELKEAPIQAIRELDRRGILHSIASKNNEAYAIGALKRFKVDEYFLSPQISWNPKSQMIKAIANSLNISIDSLVFVDDSPFERAEVSEAYPEVTVLDADDVDKMLAMPRFDVPVTKESRQRRNLYRAQERRSMALNGFDGSYFSFLRDSRIELSVQPLSSALSERVYELTQRTNQLNFSGNRYDRQRLEEIAADPGLETFVIGCRDRFGDYGTIGFSVVDRDEPRMIDLMFSCRVQGKRVEHAFLNHLLHVYRERGLTGFHATYRMTDRNKASGRVFADLHFECLEVQGEKSLLYFAFDQPIEDDGIVEIATQA